MGLWQLQWNIRYNICKSYNEGVQIDTFIFDTCDDLVQQFIPSKQIPQFDNCGST